MTIESVFGITSSPMVDQAGREHFEAMAAHLFGVGLTFTSFAQGEPR